MTKEVTTACFSSWQTLAEERFPSRIMCGPRTRMLFSRPLMEIASWVLSRQGEFNPGSGGVANLKCRFNAPLYVTRALSQPSPPPNVTKALTGADRRAYTQSHVYSAIHWKLSSCHRQACLETCCPSISPRWSGQLLRLGSIPIVRQPDTATASHLQGACSMCTEGTELEMEVMRV